MAEAAAIISGFKLLAPLAIDLLKKGYSYLGLDVDVDEKLHDLQSIIVPQIEMAIEAAENNPHKDRLRGWLKSMEEAVYEAEDELDLQDYYLLEQKVKSNAGGITVRLESLPPIKYLSKKFNIKLKKSLEKLEKTAMKAKEFLPFLSAGGSNVRRSQTTNESGRRDTTSRLPPEVVVFGRNKERDNIVDLLHETTAGDKPSVVAIVGVGGAGKTTLAQYICKHEREADPKYFDVIMWVHVSEIFDVKNLIREVVESASGEECPNLTNLDVLQSTLEDSIRSKKFLLVLDDVWIEKENVEMELEKLLAPLSAGKRGSKILMTTREKGVADALRARNIVPLEELKEDDFFAMFWHYAVGDTKNDDDKLCKELENIMRRNKQKMHGSPLAARVVGSQLRKIRDVDIWKRILSGDLLKDTMKSLLWSYQNLDAPLQRCFSYCSLFLKGDNIEREKLIHMWIAEGFIKPTDDSNRIEAVGQDYFDDLLSSSFFQPTEDDGRYTMHDLLHDLAETVSKDRCLRVEGNLTNTIPQEIRHLSLCRMNRYTLSDLIEKICNLKNLRTLIIFMWTSDDHILHNIFVKLKKLRVVHLEIHGLQNLPESIGGLKHLRYLYFYGSSSFYDSSSIYDSSSLSILPKSIYTLYHLEFLQIPNSGECRLEAKALANWINLQHLYFKYMILNVVGIDCWKQLGNRRNFYGSSIDIKGLENVKEKREVKGLENVKEKREVTTDIMDIEKLRLEWSTTDNNSRSLDMDVQVLEGFHLTPKLHDLTIVGYRGCVLPSWMVGDHRYFLPNLKFLKLYRCRRVKQLPILPPTLTQLELHDCSSLPIVSKKDLAIIKSDVRISQVVTFMEGFDATYRGSDIIASELPWDEGHGYDSQKVHNWLEKTMDIVYQNPQEEEEAQLVLPSSLVYLDIKSCPLTDSTLRAGLPGLTSLVALAINNIVSLTSLPSADVMECLTVLEYLTIGSCWFLTSLGGLQALRSLTYLFISFCPNLSAEGGNTSVLPSSLWCLNIEACHWKNLDDSQPDLTSSIDSKSSDNIPFAASLKLGHLKLLTTLSIANCPNIGSLLGLQELNNLEYLTLIGCPKLAHAETKLASLKNEFNTDAPLLLYILLAEEVIVSLRKLYIKKFKKESFRSEEERVFQHLTSLKTLCFQNCSIKTLPNNLETLSTLTSLYIDECPNIKSLPDLPRSLETLYFKNCSIKSWPNNLETLSTLTSLDIDECPNIKSLPDLPRSLETLYFKNCSIKSLPNNLETLSTLTSLYIDECPNIKSLPNLPRSLETLSFKNCSIKSLPNNLETLSTLTSLDIYECPNIKSLPDLPRSLKTLSFKNCSIKYLPNNLETLTILYIDECPNIKSLPDLPRSLIRFHLTNCNRVLKRRCQEPHGEDWPKIAHIPDVSIS